MQPRTHRVEVSEEERVRLLLLVRQGQAPARVVRRAHTLLRASEGAFDHQIACWEEQRNAEDDAVTWRFTTQLAPTRPTRLYAAFDA